MGRTAAVSLVLVILVLSTACATGPALPFDQLLAPTETIESAERSAGAEAADATATPAPVPTATPIPAVDLRPTAEVKYLRYMNTSVAAVVREQSWYATLSPMTMELVAAIQRCEKASQARGETRSVADMLKFASEQGWYTDGLDEREVKGLSAVFDAYARSLSDENSPAIGTVLSSTVRWGLFHTVQLPESGEVVLLASASNERVGIKLLQIAAEYAGPVEHFVGKFPYRFLHFTATYELPAELLGLSVNEFIFINDDAVEPYVIAHEITHSTMYGLFPLWFEEGMAYLVEYYLTATLEEGVEEQTSWMPPGYDLRIDLRSNAAYTRNGRSPHESQGFLFLKGIFDIQGAETFSANVRQLRTRSYNDNDLIRALTQSTPDKQAAMRALVCENFIGVRSVACP